MAEVVGVIRVAEWCRPSKASFKYATMYIMLTYKGLQVTSDEQRLRTSRALGIIRPLHSTPPTVMATSSKSAPRAPASPPEPGTGASASERIDARIASLADWRGAMLARLRALIHEAEPDVVEEWKWMGTPVWSRHGLICTGESYKQVVKATFAKGASLPDPSGLFNSSLDGNVRRAIDFREGDTVDADALKALIRAAVALNASKPPRR